ncbi:MAG TPA: ABC transporter permease [Candidatus Onthomonas avicola]|nr:ABC transporter permease [Candidatus Onthomonas avicola]
MAWKMAWKSVLANKLRSFLSILGILIGVISLVVLVSIVSSATGSITDTISSLGTDLLSVSITDDKENPLRLAELDTLMEEDDISLAAPLEQTSLTAKYGYTSDESAVVYGTTNPYFSIQGLTLGSGRLLLQTDVDNMSYVAVLSYETAVELVGRPDATGETVYLDGIPFLVVGVLAEEDSSSGLSLSGETTLEVYIPYTTLSRVSGSSRYVSRFYLSAADDTSLERAELAATTFLLERFDQDEDAFTIMDQSAIEEAMSSVTDTLSLMLGGIAAISLFVGGIGIMNIMLVSVTERTREIGIRKAIGADLTDIMVQFLVEALLISVLGGLMGLGMSWVILQIANLFVGETMTLRLNLQVAWLAVGFCALIGTIFGLYPAMKAARKDPIEALRYS